MSTTWILIWFVYTIPGVTSGSIEFHDKSACLKASMLMDSEISKDRNDRHAYICVEKKLEK